MEISDRAAWLQQNTIFKPLSLEVGGDRLSRKRTRDASKSPHCLGRDATGSPLHSWAGFKGGVHFWSFIKASKPYPISFCEI